MQVFIVAILAEILKRLLRFAGFTIFRRGSGTIREFTDQRRKKGKSDLKEKDKEKDPCS